MLQPTLYWIEGPPTRRMAIMSRPRGNEDLQEEIVALARLGVNAIVSMLEPDEVWELGLREEQAHCAAQGFSFISLPIPDRGTPRSAQAFIAVIRSLREQVLSGAVLAVHCRAGIGRSGLLMAGLLVAFGHSPAEALAIASSARGVKVPDTPAQEKWLYANAHALGSAT